MLSPSLAKFRLAALLAYTSILGNAALAEGVRTGIQAADMDATVRPQDDLFEYANGTWLRTVPIPSDRSSYGVVALMSERSPSNSAN
jgi:predicted metalloendopeptidase